MQTATQNPPETREQPDVRDTASGRKIVTTETRARQGVMGHNVRYVLAWGLVGVIIALAIVYYVFFAPGG